MIFSHLRLPVLTTLATVLLSTGAQAQVSAGDIVTDQVYSFFGPGNTLTADSIHAHAGSVVVLYYYTPW